MAGAILFWECIGPPEEVKGDIKANLVPLESLVTGAGRYDGKTIRVYGRFRGKNLYGDLPSRSQRQSRDWVVKDDLFAIWITGQQAEGLRVRARHQHEAGHREVDPGGGGARDRSGA